INIENEKEKSAQKLNDAQTLQKRFEEWVQQFFTNNEKLNKVNSEDGLKQEQKHDDQRGTMEMKQIKNQEEITKMMNIVTFDLKFVSGISQCHRKRMVQHMKNAQLRDYQKQGQNMWSNKGDQVNEQEVISPEERSEADEK
ncbi:MAG: hypothetical protein EZS28_024338, partial [Streblomastix strix]